MTREGRPAPVRERLALTLPADEQAPRRARAAIVAFVAAHGAGTATCRHVALAVSEAVSNVVLHAFGGPGDGVVELEVQATPWAFELVVADRGDGMRAGPSPGIGQGLHLIAAVADDLRIDERRPGPGLEVRVRFLRPGAATRP